MTVTTMATDDQRIAYALALRLAEPRDHILKATVLEHGPVRTVQLAESRGPTAVDAVLTAMRAHGLAQGPGAAHSALVRWHARLDGAEPVRELRLMARLDARIVIPTDDDWPQALSDLGLDEPIALWIRGPMSLATALHSPVAIVGTRAATDYGSGVAHELSAFLAERGHTVVSGGALGIDATAHRAALAAAARLDDPRAVSTVALLANGVDSFYPKSNSELLAQVARESLIVSEAPPGDTARRHRFLDRNRLIAALSLGTVVVEAGWRSGALDTAHRAAELGRPVGAVPGSVHSADSRGCHRLVREGAATLVTDGGDVEELVGPIEVRPEQQDPLAARPTDGLDPFELRLYDALPQRGGAEQSALAARAGLDQRQTLSALAALELYGLAKRARNGWVKS